MKKPLNPNNDQNQGSRGTYRSPFDRDAPIDLNAQKYADDFSIPQELARIIAARHPAYHSAQAFLNPVAPRLHDPATIPDIGLASDEIINAINNQEKILIYGHDDPDGYTSAALMYKTLIDLGRGGGKDRIFVYALRREKDSYMLNPEVLKAYRDQGVSVLITVDFGISSRENFKIAEGHGMRLIVCDHHETNNRDFPGPAVDPKRQDSRYPFRDLAGAGVSFKLCQVLYQKVLRLGPADFYKLKTEFLAIAMIGTIADRVRMTGENRVLCHEGLKAINRINCPWSNQLKKSGPVDFIRVNSEIIPILVSAATDDPDLGVRFFTDPDEKAVAEIMGRLKTSDEKRRQEIDRVFQDAVLSAKAFPNIIISVLPSVKMHYLGGVCSRLRDYFHRTACVITLKDDRGFGEMRTTGLDLYQMLYELRALFLDFGGHKRAAGFSFVPHNLDTFMTEAESHARQCTAEDIGTGKPEIFLDKSKIALLLPLLPFGEGNRAPLLTDGTDMYTIDNKFNIIELGLCQT